MEDEVQPKPAPPPAAPEMPLDQESLLNIPVSYTSIRHPEPRLHTGVIVRLEPAPDRVDMTPRGAVPFNIIIQLTDENDDYGKPFEVKCEVNTSMANNSNLRIVCNRLKLPHAKEILRHLLNVEVDVLVTITLGDAKGYKFAKVPAANLCRRGEGRARQVAIIVPAVPADDPIVGELYRGRKS